MRLYFGTYGHGNNPNAKFYAYWGDDNYHVGQRVVVPVNHYISGKDYKTMFTINRSDSLGSSITDNEGRNVAQIEELRLLERGIKIKNIEGRDFNVLKGSKQYANQGGTINLSKWTRDSKREYQAKTRLLSRGTSFDTTTSSNRAQQRLLGGYSNG